MDKKYEIALSYAHLDWEIANMIGKQLDFIFSDSFFMDEYRPEELANADVFEEKLKDIFRRSDYAVILYSKNYSRGNFTVVEMQQILEKNQTAKDSNCFILNIDDCAEIHNQIPELTYTAFSVYGSNKNGDDKELEGYSRDKVQERIYNIVHNKIKKNIFLQKAAKKENQKEFGIRVQTLCPFGHEYQWDKVYDWNILGKAFIREEDGRKLKEGILWQDFWNYIAKEFGWMIESLRDAPKVTRRIYLHCHLSIAFKLGQMYGDLRQASGNRNLILVSSNRVKNTEFSFQDTMQEKETEDYCQQYDGNSLESADIVCIISVKPYEQGNVLDTVKQYLEQRGKKYAKIYLFKRKMTIENADTLESMATYLRVKMMECRTGNKCIIHLFPDTTAPLMFALGARSVFTGTIQLYEYIPKEDTYTESLTN